jgi:hypothetical protein
MISPLEKISTTSRLKASSDVVAMWALPTGYCCPEVPVGDGATIADFACSPRRRAGSVPPTDVGAVLVWLTQWLWNRPRLNVGEESRTRSAWSADVSEQRRTGAACHAENS